MNSRKPKLLIIDDEVDVCTFVQSYFGRRGFIVSTTGNGEEALTMIEVSKPDLVLLDLTLDYAMSGMDLLEELREHDKETRVVVISGNNDPAVIDKLYTLGIRGFYKKPLILEDLAKVVYAELGIEFNNNLENKGLEVKTDDPKIEGNVHQLSNKLNIIRGESEEFLLDYEEGYYKHKTRIELLKLTVDIIKKAEGHVESFLVNYGPGVLKEKTSDELFKMNLEVIKNFIKTVDNTMTIIEQKNGEKNDSN